KPKYILITNPNNPTGTTSSYSSLKEVVEIAKDNDIFLISDEIYDELIFNDAKFTPLSKIAKGVPHMILNGASKNLFATGFRIGFCIIPENDKKSISLKNAITKLANSRLSANTPAEYAVAEGISNIKKRKEFLKSALQKIEKNSNLAYKLAKNSEYLEVVKPNSAFYIFPRIKFNKLNIKNDKEFTETLLKEQHLQVLRGSGFGTQGFIRLITLPDEQVIEEAFSRLEKFFEAHKKEA
ncbi:MAG: aminotransferase class I/II-fold pyridoxal phosphate-dependent enzyme, partial [Candidatus Micrarchaeaceae archaeon]